MNTKDKELKQYLSNKKDAEVKKIYNDIYPVLDGPSKTTLKEANDKANKISSGTNEIIDDKNKINEKIQQQNGENNQNKQERNNSKGDQSQITQQQSQKNDKSQSTSKADNNPPNVIISNNKSRKNEKSNGPPNVIVSNNKRREDKKSNGPPNIIVSNTSKNSPQSSSKKKDDKKLPDWANLDKLIDDSDIYDSDEELNNYLKEYVKLMRENINLMNEDLGNQKNPQSSNEKTKKDYLKVLNLEDSATIKDIKKRYKTLARNYHPDKNTNDKNKEQKTKKFIEITDAYEKLKKIMNFN